MSAGQRMEGKICLVTGATSGIGRQTALGLALLGAHLVIAGRDRARLANVADAIRAGMKEAKVECLAADLSVQAEVRRLAGEFRKAHERLDVLVNNAGAIFPDRRLTADGFERTWALNHLGYVLLTAELLGLLKAAASARIVNVASAAHFRGRIEFDNLQAEREFTPMGAYSRSKLGNVLFTYALARRLAGSGITANCLHPGVVRTGFGRGMKGLFGFGLGLAKPFFISAAKGAETAIYLASSAEAAGASGQYFYKCRPEASSPQSHDEALQERLWALGLQQTGTEAAFS